MDSRSLIFSATWNTPGGLDLSRSTSNGKSPQIVPKTVTRSKPPGLIVEVRERVGVHHGIRCGQGDFDELLGSAITDRHERAIVAAGVS